MSGEKKQIFRAAVVGCGAIGSIYDENRESEAVHTHAGMYHRLDDYALIAGVDPDAERLERFAETWRVPRVYGSLNELLENEETDLISIATPDETHEALIRECLAARRRPRLIFTEKPFAASSAAARDIAAAAREKNVRLVVDYIRRWDQAHNRIRDFLASRSLGRIQAVVGYYVRGVRHNGCQMINLLHFLFGRIKTVQALGAVDRGSFLNDPSLHLNLLMRDGTFIQVIALDQCSYSYSMFELDIFGEQGRIRLLDGGQAFEFHGIAAHPDFSNFKRLSPERESWLTATYDRSMLNAGAELAAILRGDQTISVNEAGSAVDDLAAIEAAEFSARAGNSMQQVEYPR